MAELPGTLTWQGWVTRATVATQLGAHPVTPLRPEG